MTGESRFSGSGFSAAERRRIALTVAVHDCDAIPKVVGAGEVRDVAGVSTQTMHNGLLVLADAYYGEWMTEVIRCLRGHHEPQEELAFHVVLERLATDTREPVVLELGSFWAYYAMWAQRTIPGARLFLVEPDRGHREVGVRNLELNGLEAVTLDAAIGSRHDVTLPHRWESDGIEHPTRQVNVDGLMSDLGLERVDLLVCDVQGAETAVLEGASRALADRRLRFLLLSTHHHSISGDPLTHQHCLQQLRDSGAHIIAEHSVAESCSGDGLIVASLDPRDDDLRAAITVVRARDSLFGELEWDLARALGRPGVPSPPWP